MKINEIKRPWSNDTSHRHNIRGDRSFYQTSAWRSTRNAYIKANPWCVDCEKEGKKVKADVVDHKKQVILDGDKFNPDNLQSLCHPHHNAKSAREKNAMYNAGRK